MLCLIDDFAKYAWVKLLIYKEDKTVLNDFTEIISESSRKLNKLWVDQGRIFYNKLVQEWIDDNDMLKNSIHNEGK